MFASVALCRSTKPLLKGLSAAVTFIKMLKLSAKVKKSLLANSPPLSDKIFFGEPKTEIQYCKIFLIITSGFLEEQILEEEKRVA